MPQAMLLTIFIAKLLPQLVQVAWPHLMQSDI
jgi:hypothetical protein